MRVSHEVPISLLKRSWEYNDYDYCLVHLMDIYPAYRDYYLSSKETGRIVLLDNSLFELRKAFEASAFAKWITELRPRDYIVPDAYADSAETITNFKNWIRDYGSIPGGKIGVVQGDTYENLVECYKFMLDHADTIAFSFECPYFKQYRGEDAPNKFYEAMRGRQAFLRKLADENILTTTKPIHLLGCMLPQEFIYYYKKPEFFGIQSLDTSSPIVAGLHGVQYKLHGLDEKIPTKLVDHIEDEVSKETMLLIRENILHFHRINKI